MSSFRFSTPGSYGLMGRTLNPLRETLDRTFAEDDRLQAELERWEWERRSKEKAPVVKPMVETVSASDLRVIKRSHSDGIERVWIAGWPRSKYLIAGIANTASVNSHNCVQLPRGAELNLPIPVLWRHAKYGGAIGEVCFLQRDDKAIYICAAIHSHEAGQYAWKKIVLGEVSGFSMAAEHDQFLHLQAEVGDVRFYDKWKIKEVSIVPEPACPGCYFKIYSPFADRKE